MAVGTALAGGMAASGGTQQIFGGIIGGIKSYKAIKAARAAHEERVSQIRKRATEEERLLREQGERIISSQHAAVGASGLLSAEGSPLLVFEETQRQIEEDALTIRERAKEAIRSSELAMGQQQHVAADAFAGQIFGLADTLLTSGASVYNAYTQGVPYSMRKQIRQQNKIYSMQQQYPYSTSMRYY